MTTPPGTPDPFATPTANASAPQPPMSPPGYSQVAAPMYTPISVPSAVPSKLALWAIVLTGAYAAVSILGAVTAPEMIDGLKERLADPQNASPFAGQSAASFISIPVSIASYILLALWMSRIRNTRKARGEIIGGPPAVEWWGWFVPLANFVLPFLGMRAITKARASMGLLLGWWLAYVASLMIAFASAIPQFTAIDFTTGELTHPEALDSIVGLTWASAIALVVSWVFLAMIIRVTTSREAESV